MVLARASPRCRPALDLEFQVRRSGAEKPENGARDFFLGDKGGNLVFSWWIHMAIDGRD